MYMGNQRRAIVLKDSKNCMFEAAYFILKDGFENQNESEMIKEANRILKNNIIGSYFFREERTPKKHKSLNGLACFLLGALLSFVFCTVLFLFL